MKSGNRLIECIDEFIHSKYNVLTIQEHKLDKKAAEDAINFCDARAIAAHFPYRSDEAAREGTAILIKLKPLAITADDITFDDCANSKCTTAAFTTNGRKEKIASVYLPTRPSERGTTIAEICESELLKGATVIGGDFNCVPDTNLDLSYSESYENAHAHEWESYLTSLGLTDVLREQTGHKKGPFTRMPARARYTRIDRLLAKPNPGVIHSASIDETFGFTESRPTPDHKAITLERKYVNKEDRGSDVVRLDVELFKDEPIRNQIRDMFYHIYRMYDTDIWGHAPIPWYPGEGFRTQYNVGRGVALAGCESPRLSSQ